MVHIIYIGSYKIIFDFYYNDNNTEQIQPINLLLSSCVGLKELQISQQILESLQELSYECVRTLICTGISKEQTLNNALGRFPKLVKIDISCVRILDIATIF